jgi:hypothetical protein
MKLALLLSRHRRLLALCGLSAAAHLLVLELAARRVAAPPSAAPVGEALRLRLVQAAAPAAETPPGPLPVAPPAPARSAPQIAPEPAATPSASTASVPPAPSPGAAVAAAPTAPASEPAGTPLIQMPSRYRVRMPDPVRLSYALTRQVPGSVPVSAGSAGIAWTSDGEHYTLAVDGVLGQLRSEGGSSDAGIAPRNAPDAVGAQDPASVLMQLAGIGLAEPDQIVGQVGNELRIVVGDAGGAGIARYQVMGQENLPTALGELSAWRLAQVVPAGQDRLELWLAPGQGWLPVQLRITRPDGSVATQTLTRIEAGQAR